MKEEGGSEKKVKGGSERDRKHSKKGKKFQHTNTIIKFWKVKKGSIDWEVSKHNREQDELDS